MPSLRLRGSQPQGRGPYALGDIPTNVLEAIGRHVVHRLAVGQPDVSGNDVGSIFADSIGGTHLASPLGIADVVWEKNTAWSVKTVKLTRPSQVQTVRLISGRCSPTYSHGTQNVLKDPCATGRQVLDIWNARLNQAVNDGYHDMRVFVLVRDMVEREFVAFEEEARRVVPEEYRWAVNQNGNLEAHDKGTGVHRFTWQPHGSQLTVIRSVPQSARWFRIVVPVPRIDQDEVLSQVGFDKSWLSV